MADALLHASGPAGAMLSAVLAFERGVIADGLGAAHDVAAVGAAYREALRWTHGVTVALA